MTERTNRRDQIIDVSARLFMDHGYTATSVRQIAEEVGCTEAALYYHFKDKRALLQAVVECNLPDLVAAITDLEQTTSLGELVERFIYNLHAKAESHLAEKIRWITREFPKLSADERELIYDKHLEFRSVLFGIVRRFVQTDEAADNLTWLMLLMVFGYGQLMLTMDMGSVIPFDLSSFATEIRRRLATTQ